MTDTRLVALAGGVVVLLVAAAAWLTGGALTFTSIQPGASRIGVLPSPAWLALCLLVVIATRTALRTNAGRFALLSLSMVLVVPWLPVTVPAAFYIWTGPLRIWLWVAVVVGLAAPAVIRLAPAALARTVQEPRRAPWLAATAALVVYLIGAYQVSPRLPTGDEPHYLVIAQSVLRDRDLKIENNHSRGDYREYFAGNLRPDYLRRSVNGEIYSVHAPGLAVMVAPAFAVLGYPGVSAFLALFAASATALAWIAVWRMTSDAWASWFGWATVALTAPFFFQSFVVYPDAPGAALVMVGVLALVGGQALSTRQLVATGAALATLPWLHTRYVAAAVTLGIMILARHWTAPADSPSLWAGRVRQAAALLALPVVSAACWFGFFYAIYGSPDPRGPYGGHTQSAIANLSRGIVGLLFDQQFGVLPAAPVFVCALAGLPALARRSPRLTAELLILAAPYTLVVGAYQMWWGGNSSPARFIVPVLLPMAIPAGVWFHTRRGYTGRLLGLGTLFVSLLTTITLVGVDHGMLLYNVRDGSSRLLLWLSPLVNITTGLPSVFQTSASAALWHGLAWIAAIALTAAVGLAVERRGVRPARLAVVLGFSAMMSAAAALSIVWYDHHGTATAPLTLSAGTAAFLRRYDPDSGQFALRVQPLRLVRMRDALTGLTLADDMFDPPRDPAVALFHPPAGTYALEASAAGGAGLGPITATLDRDVDPQWSWNPDHSTATWREEIRLPVSTPVLAVRATGARHLVVRPVSIVGSRHRLVDHEPLQVARYGPAIMFLVRGQAFMERAGTWVAGGSSADFIVSPDDGNQVRLFIRNPPVENEVTLEGTGWREHLTLRPGEERVVALPVAPDAGATWIRVTAAHGARPAEFEPGNVDARFLGCWIEPRP